jgi:ribosome-associated toxin RatA of RatAB toxin-antitoxin module
LLRSSEPCGDAEGRSAIVAEQATERIVVRAVPERCYSVVTDFEHYPRWASDIKSVQVLDRDEEGRATSVAFRAAAFGRSTSYTLAYDYASAPEKLSWVQTAGDITTRLDGTYVFVAVGEDETEVVYHLVAELRVPIPGFVKRRAEGRIMGTALRNLRDRVESGG